MSERTSRRSRYDRPRHYVSWTALLIGILLGAGGGVFFAWNVSPTEEINTAPWQLRRIDQQHYVVAVMMSYDYDGDLTRTVNNLLELRPSVDPLQYVADVACDLARSGYVSSSSGLNALRVMMSFYQGQGKQGCADTLIPAQQEAVITEEVVIAATSTLQPPPSKTPTPELQVSPTATSAAVLVQTIESPQSTFRIARLDAFCDVDLSGVIEVFVQDTNGAPVPGVQIRVRWDQGENVFLNGLKPERGYDYADFQMEINKGYTIDMPGLADPSTTPIVALPCTTDTGEASVQSYRVFFRPSFE